MQSRLFSNSRLPPWSRWLLMLLALSFLTCAQAVTVPGPLVDTEWLAENLDNVVILDVRKDKESFEKRPRGTGPVNPCGPGARKGPQPLLVAGHIPDAVLVPWKAVTGKRKVEGVEIKVIVPEKEKFEKLMRESGVNNDSAIVITSKGQEPIHAALAVRLYWTLKYFGHDNVAMLNGGTAQWMLDKRRVEFGKSRAEDGTFKISTERPEILATMGDVMKLSKRKGGNEQLLDVRGEDVYLGLTRNAKFVPPEGMGHIPNAKSFPTSFMVNTMGPAATLYSKDKLEQVARLVGIDTAKPTTAYCDTGVMASLGWFALHEVAGNKNARMYDGSMQEWAKTGKPVVAMEIE
jgi:thiosulfate/3-mercaptopyruvate sulfurtransferase